MSESLPPLTVNDLKNYLCNPAFSVYVFVGSEEDKGWKVAEAIHGLLPAHRIYRTADRSLVQELFGDHTEPALVYGWTEEPRFYLTQVEAEDFLTAFGRVKQARGEKV